MAKLTNIRERVQQPFRDALVRTSGLYAGTLQDRTNLFSNGTNKDVGSTNLPSGNQLPSDNSMIVLALRVFTWFRQSILRGEANNGDVSDFPNGAGEIGENNVLGATEDVYRLYWQSQEQLFWTFGAGGKPSIELMPSAYFPYGGGLPGDLGGASDIINLYNGDAGHDHVLKLARAILLVPRQSIKCEAVIQALPDGGQATTFGTTQGSRNMLSLTANLNAVDAIQKVITFTFDGLFSRDVQLPALTPLRREPSTSSGAHSAPPFDRGLAAPSGSSSWSRFWDPSSGVRAP